jgi:glycosyltransferase involved in cell wall biosynthesis
VRIDLVAGPDADGAEATGGTPIAAAHLAVALRTVGVDARFVTIGLAGSARSELVDPATQGNAGPRSRGVHLGLACPPTALRQLWQIDPPELVHACGPLAAEAAMHAAPEGLPIVVSLGPSARPLGGRTEGGVDLLELARAAALVVAASRVECRHLLHAGIAGARIAYLPHAVELPAAAPAAWHGRASGAARAALHIGHLACPDDVDGLVDLLDALARTADASATIVEPSGRAEAAIRAAAAERGIGPRVEVIAAEAPDRALAVAAQAPVDVAVCCPRTPVAGLAALDAMAHGLPVIATRVDGLREVVVHEATGLHVGPGAADELARALEILRDDPIRRHLYGLSARTRARRHSFDRVGLHASLAYARVIAGPTRQRREGRRSASGPPAAEPADLIA